MLVKDVIIKACDFIGKEEMSAKLKAGETLASQEDELIETLVKQFNLVREEIASEYQPILKSESFVVKNFKLEFSSFSSPVLEIYSIKDRLGRNVNYKIFDGYIFVCGKDVEVIYSTLAEGLTIEDEFSATLPERIFAYGVAREYFFHNGFYEDANMWEGRFKGSLEIVLRRKSRVQIPKRRWL